MPKSKTQLCVSILLLYVAANGFAQTGLDMRREQSVDVVPKSVASDLMPLVNAIGSRMQRAGKEQTVLEGQITDVNGQTRTIQIMHQLSGLVRIRGLKDKIDITFDGQ